MGIKLNKLLKSSRFFFRPVFKLLISADCVHKTQQERIFGEEYYPVLHYVYIHSFQLDVK